MIHRRRPAFPQQPAPIVESLRVARNAMIASKRGVDPFGSAYRAADAVMTSIDAFATLLTGDPRYFWLDPHGGGQGPLGTRQDKQARELGQQPWKRLDP